MRKSTVTALRDCKSWYEAGDTTSGVYTINPDGQTPFEVSNYYNWIVYYCLLSLSTGLL